MSTTFVALVLPAGLSLTTPQYVALAESCGTGYIIEGLAPIYMPYMTEADLPAVFTEVTVEACEHIVIDTGGAETFEYDDCYIVSVERTVNAQAACAVSVLDGIFGVGGW